MDSENVHDVTSKNVKHLSSPLQATSSVESDKCVESLLSMGTDVLSGRVNIPESDSVISGGSESNTEVFEKELSSENCSRNAETVAGLSCRTILAESENGDLYNEKGAQNSCDSVRETSFSKTNKTSVLTSSLVNTDCESVQYLEPISDDENSLLCAPSSSSGLSSVSGFQSNSNTPMFSDTPSDASRGTLMVRISDAVAAILSDVSDESLPASPLASNSNSEDNLKPVLPGKTLSDKINSICENLDIVCTKNSSTDSLPIKTSNVLLSHVHLKNIADSNFDKERTLQECTAEKTKSIKDIISDTVQPELSYAEIQKEKDLAFDLPTLSSPVDPVKGISCENTLSEKSTCEWPTSVIPDKGVKEQGFENQPQETYISTSCVSLDSVHSTDKLTISGSQSLFGHSSSSVPGLFSDVNTAGHSLSPSTVSSDTLVDFSLPSQVPLKDLGTNNYSNLSNTGNNLCQNPVSGSQTISSQTQNCNTLQNEETASGLLGMPSTITLNNPGQPPKSVNDDFLHTKCSTHLENQSPWNSMFREENSSLETALKFSCVPPISPEKRSHLSLVPVVDLGKNSCPPENNRNFSLPDKNVTKSCMSVKDSVDVVDDLLQAKSGILQLVSEISHSAVVESEAFVKPSAEGIQFPSSVKEETSEVLHESSVKKTDDSYSSEKSSSQIGFLEKSPQEPITALLMSTASHSSVTSNCITRGNCMEDQTENSPNSEVSLQKTALSSDCKRSLSPTERMVTNNHIKTRPFNKDSFVICSSNIHGITSVPHRGTSSTESADGDISLLRLTEDMSSSIKDDLDEKRKSSEDLYCNKESTLNAFALTVAELLPESLKKSESSFETEKNSPKIKLSFDKSTVSTEMVANRSNYSAKPSSKEEEEEEEVMVVSKVPITDVKSSLFTLNTTHNSVVSHLFSTIVPIAKQESIDKVSYGSPSEVEWNTNSPCPHIFTTSDKVSSQEESTSANVLGSFRNTSEYSRPKNKCHPSGGISRNLTHSSCASSNLYTDSVIKSTLPENECHIVSEIDHCLASIVKKVSEIRPPCENIEDTCLPAKGQVNKQEVPPATSSEQLLSLVGIKNNRLLVVHDRPELSSPQVAVKSSHSLPEVTETIHMSAAVSDFYHTRKSDVEFDQPAFTSTRNICLPSVVPDDTCDLAHVFGGMQVPTSVTAPRHSAPTSAETSDPHVVVDTGAKLLSGTVNDAAQSLVATGAAYLKHAANANLKCITGGLLPDASEINHPSVDTTEVTHPSSETTSVSHSLIEGTKVSSLPAEVSPPTVEAAEVAHPSAEVASSSAKVTEVVQLSAKATKNAHSSAKATEVVHPSAKAKATKVSHIPGKNTKVGDPLSKVSKTSHSFAEAVVLSNPSCDNIEVVTLSSEVAAVNNTSTEAAKVNQPLVNYPSTYDFVNFNLSSESSEIDRSPFANITETGCSSLETTDSLQTASEINNHSEVNKASTLLTTIVEIEKLPNHVYSENGGDLVTQTLNVMYPVTRATTRGTLPQFSITNEGRPPPADAVLCAKSHITSPEADDQADSEAARQNITHCGNNDKVSLIHSGAEVALSLVHSEDDDKQDAVYPDADIRPGLAHSETNGRLNITCPEADTKLNLSHPNNVRPATVSTPEIDHPAFDSEVEVKHTTDVVTAAVEQTLCESTEVRPVTVEMTADGQHTTSKTTAGVSCRLKRSAEINHLRVEAISEVCHKKKEASTKACFSVFDKVEHPQVDKITNVSHLTNDKITAKVSESAIKSVTAEVSHSEHCDITEVSDSTVDEITAESSHKLFEAVAEFNHPSPEARIEVSKSSLKPTLDCRSKLVSPLVSTGVMEGSSQMEPFIDDGRLWLGFKSKTVTSLGEVTQRLENPFCQDACNFDENECGGHNDCLSARILSSVLGATKSDFVECTVIGGTSTYNDRDDSGDPPRIHLSNSQTNNPTSQEASSLNENLDIGSNDEDKLLLELAPVKEEVQQSAEDLFDGVLSNVEEVWLATTDTSSSVSDCLPFMTDAHIREEQVPSNMLEGTTSERDDKAQELDAIEAECPLCFLRLNVPLDNHLTKCHVCNTFVPAKATYAYQYHMLKRVKDVMEIPEPVEIESSAYVCRLCHFASRDIDAVRFHLNTHEAVYQVRVGDVTCECNQKKYSYPFHKWKTLIHNSSYYCFKCNYYFACEKGFSNHLKAIHFIKNCCKICKAQVPEESIISHATCHKDDRTSLISETVNQQSASVVTRSSGGNFGISWNIYDNYINFLDGKFFHLSTLSKVSDPNLDRSYLTLPLKNVREEAVVPDEARIDPGKDIAKYMKGKKSIKISLDDEFIKNFSLSIQMELQKKILKKGRKGHGSTPRAKRENDLFDILGISTLRSRGTKKKETSELSVKQIPLKKPIEKLDQDNKKETDNPEVPLLTRTRSGMQSGKGDQEDKNEIKSVFAEPSVVVDGEWSKAHTYICCSCGAGYWDLADIMDHKWEVHPSVWCAHTMIQGQGEVPLSFCMQYQPPTTRPYRLPLPGIPLQQTRSSRRNSDTELSETEKINMKTCSSCSMQFQDLNVFHAHLVECGGLALLSAMKKKSKKGFRFKRRKGQGVPNNRYGNSSQPSTPMKAKSGDRSSGLNTPQNDRSSTAFVHSSGVKRRLELAVGSIDNLELKNRLKAIISGTNGSGNDLFRLPGRRTVRMKLRKKALETRKLRKTRHSDRVKENSNRNDEIKELKKVVGKGEKENISDDPEGQNIEELQDTKKSGVKATIDIVKESKPPRDTVDEVSKSKEKLKKKVMKIAAAKAEGNNINEENKAILEVTNFGKETHSKSKKKSKQEGDREVLKAGKKMQTEKKINGVIDKAKKTKKKVETCNVETQTPYDNIEIKMKQLPLKKLTNKTNKITLTCNKIAEICNKSGNKKIAGLVAKKDSFLKKNKFLTGKQNLGKKSIGAKLVVTKNLDGSDNLGGKVDQKLSKKVISSKIKSLDSQYGQEAVNPPLPATLISPETLVEEKKAKPKKIRETGSIGSNGKHAEVEKRLSHIKKSINSDQSTMLEVMHSEDEMKNLLKEVKTNVQEISKHKENEVKEIKKSKVPKLKKKVLYYSSSSEDSDSSYDSEPEVIRNFRSGRSCGGRMGLRSKRIPINSRYSFRKCSTAKNGGDSSTEDADDKQNKVDYLEKEEEEFSEELPVTSKRRRKVANYENQDDYTYVPYDSSSDFDLSEKEMDDSDRKISLSSSKKRKITRASREISNPIKNALTKEDSKTLQEVQNTKLEDIVTDVRDTNQLQVDPSIVDPCDDAYKVNVQKGKKSANLVNPCFSDLSGKEDNIDCETKIPKKKKRKLINVPNDEIDITEDKILKNLSKKVTNVKVVSKLSSSNTLQEVQDNVKKIQRKNKTIKEIKEKLSISNAQKDNQGISVKFKDVKLKSVSGNVQVKEYVNKNINKKCVKLSTDFSDTLHAGEIQPITETPKNVKSSVNFIGALVKSVPETPLPVMQDNIQEVASLASKEKNKGSASVGTCTDGEQLLQRHKFFAKLQKKKKPAKYELKANNVLQYADSEHLGQLLDESFVKLPTVTKRNKKIYKKSTKILESLNQNLNIIKGFTHVLTEEEEDELPLSALAQQRTKKEKLASEKKNNKGTRKPKPKKTLLTDKRPLLVKNHDSLIKESVAHDSESSSFEGFIPVPSKKACRNKTAVKKPRKKLDLVKVVMETNNSSTASESELSDVSKPIRKPKKMFTSPKKLVKKDIRMPNLTKVSKAESVDNENLQLNHQSSVKNTYIKKLKAIAAVCDSSEDKSQVVQSKENPSSCMLHSMPVLEPMNVFKPCKEETLDPPESDSNGEGGVTLTSKMPAKIKRRRSSVEKIKDIPTRSSVLGQVQESQNLLELKEVINEPVLEDVGVVSCLAEHQVPLLKETAMKPPQPRKKRIRSSQEHLLKNKSESTLDPPLEIKTTEEVTNLDKEEISAAHKMPAKRKRAASTSGVPFKDGHELINPLVKDTDEALVNVASLPKKNCINTKRKKTGNNTKHDVNELKCIDCGLKFGSLASLEDHQQDCVTIAFEMSLMEAEDHLFECPHCHLTFALKGTQRKHTTSCRLVKYKRSSHRHDSKTLKRTKNSASLHTQFSEDVVTSSDVATIVETTSRKASVKARRCSKENVASDKDGISSSLQSDVCVASFTNHTEKIGTSLSESNLKENINKAGNMQKIVPVTSRGSPRTKKESQVNGKIVNVEFLEYSSANIGNNQQCLVCGHEITDQDISNKHQLLQQFSNRCQQQSVLDVCAVITYYNLGFDAVRSLVTSAIVYQGSTLLSLDAKQQSSFNTSSLSSNASNSCAIKLREILASPHCTRMSSTLETIAKHHQSSDIVSISGTRQEALKAVSTLEEILKEISEAESVIKKNRMLKSMRETFEAGTLT
ncbi:hypothetical protein OTU49_000257 [Cherax quadricarinatus]|uniref:C2H2-type domain-containing protein n=2 Tax=Cherax quadricarinatus TaxID=27406 RepID=A0AAW0YPE3_CHEQU